MVRVRIDQSANRLSDRLPSLEANTAQSTDRRITSSTAPLFVILGLTSVASMTLGFVKQWAGLDGSNEIYMGVAIPVLVGIALRLTINV